MLLATLFCRLNQVMNSYYRTLATILIYCISRLTRTSSIAISSRMTQYRWIPSLPLSSSPLLL